MEISKTYEPQQIEKKWYEFWEKNEYFQPEGDTSKPPFTVLMPPPNVTGILHMGHVLNNTLQDIVIRYHRMLGESTLWLPGVDHAGIATQNMVEKELAKEGKTRQEIGREKMLELIWKWKEEKGGLIIDQLKMLGASCDWSRLRFTMDDMLSRAVKEVFIRLYDEGLIYKGKYIINWCPRCETALANDEVEYSEENGNLWYIRYPLVDESGFVVVATTRPETMFADQALMVHPDDKRYQKFVGKKVYIPNTKTEIPVITDNYVDMTFGTGVVKVTPAHDPNDFMVGERHNLEMPLCMNEDGTMNEMSGKYNGLDRFEARQQIIADLEVQGLVEKIEDYHTSIGYSERTGVVVEPRLSLQWFLKMDELAKDALHSNVEFVPSRFEKIFKNWMTNTQDWCVSR